MKLLLDTHTFLWLVDGSPNLSVAANAALGDPANQLFLNVASVWELAIKTGNQKLVLSDPLDVFVGKWSSKNIFQVSWCRRLACKFGPCRRAACTTKLFLDAR